METIFSIEENDLRMKENEELVYSLTNKRQDSQVELSFDDMIRQLTPSRRKLVLTAIELYKRDKSKNLDIISSSRAAYEILFPILSDLNHEELWVMFVNNSNKVVKRVMVSSGGKTETAADITLILKGAILNNATGILIAHNHPSGTLRPSHCDVVLTDRLKDSCKLIGIRLLDHIIVGIGEYYSFADEGKI